MEYEHKYLQKFIHGDLVMIDEDLGYSMSHFPSGKRAVVNYSYSDVHDGSNHTSYGLCVEGEGYHAWYDENQLTFIEHGRRDLFEKWKNVL